VARGRPSKKGVIIEAAAELFTLKGYQGTSIDQVVITAAVSKPTVYSNFPTKLVLWESVLESLIEQADVEMNETLVTQKTFAQAYLEQGALDHSGIIAGWIALWKAWSNSAKRLAVYRILLGEQHKMAATTVALFAQFEAVLERVLLAWLDAYKVPTENFFVLKAVSKEALLTPSLLNQTALPVDVLERQLSLIIHKEAE